MLVAGMVLCVTLLASCSPLEAFKSHQEFVDTYVADSELIQRHYFGSGDNRIFYAQAGRANKGLVLWLHGTPGSWSDIGRIMLDDAYTQEYLWVSVARKGWAESSVALKDKQKAWQQHRENFASFDQQVEYLLPLVAELKRKYPGVPLIVAGHSWGASLAPMLALAAESFDGMVLMAGGFSPELMHVRWYHHLARTWLGRAAIGDQMERATEEMFALPVGLRQLDTKLMQSEALRKLPIYLVQGGKDSLVPVKNAYHWQNSLSNESKLQGLEVFVDDDYGHLWHMSRPEVIAECVVALLEDQPERCGTAVAASNTLS